MWFSLSLFVVLSVFSGSSYSISKNENYDRNTNLLRSLISDYLNDSRLSIITYDNVENYIDLNGVIQKAYQSNISVFVTNNEQAANLVHESPSHYFRGRFFKTILIFFNDPLPFLEKIFTQNWNPDYFILFSLDLNLDTEPILAHNVVQRSRYILLIEQSFSISAKYVFFSSKPHLVIGKKRSVKKLIGSWSKKYDLNGLSLFPERFDNFHNTEVYLAFICDDFPFLYLVGDECKGSNLDLLDMISGNLNFSFKTQTENMNYDWGFKYNDTWTGMLGELFYEKNISVNSLSLETELSDFDFTFPYYYYGYSFALRVPSPIPQWRTVLLPFTNELWIMFIVATIGVVILLTGALTLIKDSQKPDMVFLLVIIYLLFCSFYIKIDKYFTLTHLMFNNLIKL